MARYQDAVMEALQAKGSVTAEQVVRAREESAAKGMRPVECLIDAGSVNETDVLRELSAISGIPLVDLNELSTDPDAVRAVPAKFTWHYRFMPVALKGKQLTVACSWPLSVNVQDELRLMLGYKVDMVLARGSHIRELLNRNYGLGSDTVGRMMEKQTHAEPVDEREEVEDIEKLAEDASVISLVNQIIFEAYKKRATDIHIEPYRDRLRLRYRIDGVLQDQKVPEEVNRFIMSILSRIKIMSDLNIVEKRVPQDGRAVVRTQEGMLDLRVSFIPTPHGESVVIRILPTGRSFDIDKLGLTPEGYALVRSLIAEPSGIIFVTGPTGSGKTTTLYACIKEVNKLNRKIITIEDPIEYEMDNVTQIQVNKATGLSFANGLRSMLRHDPDIMMVGEVRDKETAEIAIRVALTGHLVFSTLHTNDAVGGITRLLDIGIAPYLISSSVQAFIAQRLVRVLCPECKVENEDVDESIKDRMKASLRPQLTQEMIIYAPKGCDKCDRTGFRGRTGIYEMLPVTERISRLISSGAGVDGIERQAMAEGMRSLMQSGWEKVARGETTPEEVLKVCQDLRDPLAPHDVPGSSGADGCAPVQAVNAPGPSSGVSAVHVPEEITGVETGPEEPPAADKPNRRLHKRLNVELPVQYKLITKGEGDILKLDIVEAQAQGQLPRSFEDKIKDDYADLITASSVLHTKVAEDSFKKDVYDGSASILCNISAGGMLFESRYQLPVGSVLEVAITLPGKSDSKQIRSLAKVVRVEKSLPRGFLTAVMFLDSTGEDRRYIDRFVEEKIAGLFK